MYYSSSTQSSIHILQIRSSLKKPLNTLVGVCYAGPKDQRANKNPRLHCKAVIKPRTEEYKDVFLPHIEGEEALEVNARNKVKENIDSIRSMLRSMNDGDISLSAYDTAWVALVEDIHGNGGPQFPTSLQWISNNQLPDGSWGDSLMFEPHDRLISTLACVIPLESWKIHPDQSKTGMEFIKENMQKLEDANAEHMTIGFEVAFPSLIEMGRKLNIELPVDDSPILQEIYARRNLKLTRMHTINNNKLLELARLDYKNSQALHLLEWDAIQQWYVECHLGEVGTCKKNLLFAYYLATASIFEPEKSKERLAWTKTKILMEAIVSYFENEGSSAEHRRAFLGEFRKIGTNEDCANNMWHKKILPGQGLVPILLITLNQLLVDAQLTHGEDIRDNLHQAWEMWILTWQHEGDMHRREAELVVRAINLCAACGAPEKLSQLSHPRHKRLSDVTNEVCYQLLQFQHQKPSRNKIHDNDEFDTTLQIESDMQELVQLVVCASSDDIDPDIKQTFLAVAKSYYYAAHFTPATIDFHIAKVLFEPVI